MTIVDEDASNDDVDPTISFGIVVRMPASKVPAVREFFLHLGARIVIAKIAGPKRLWLVEQDEPRDGRT